MTELLDANADRERWLRLWRKCGREPFAHPSFCQVVGGDAGRAVALSGVQPHGSWLLPLQLRPLPWVEEELYDAVSPYGYGGPFLSGDVDLEWVLTGCQQWLTDGGICSAFLRVSLDIDLAPGSRTETMRVVDTASSVVVDLRRTPDELWAHYEHKVRKNVKKALRAGCTVRRDEHLDDIDTFVGVYESTMLRRAASSWYHFDARFFECLSRELLGSYSVFSVLDMAGEVVSVELVLESDHYLYSFLGGTRAEAFPMAPNDLLKHEVALYGQRTGRRGFVLGGGYEPEDGIFRYKRSFDPTGVVPFRTVRMIGNLQQYFELAASRDRQDEGTRSAQDFFPAYRSPLGK
jgi:Acetyltransferase (GNAT) domain